MRRSVFAVCLAVLCALPAFSQGEISPEELDDLVDYLKALRNHSGKQQI